MINVKLSKTVKQVRSFLFRFRQYILRTKRIQPTPLFVQKINTSREDERSTELAKIRKLRKPLKLHIRGTRMLSKFRTIIIRKVYYLCRIPKYDESALRPRRGGQRPRSETARLHDTRHAISGCDDVSCCVLFCFYTFCGLNEVRCCLQNSE